MAIAERVSKWIIFIQQALLRAQVQVGRSRVRTPVVRRRRDVSSNPVVCLLIRRIVVAVVRQSSFAEVVLIGGGMTSIWSKRRRETSVFSPFNRQSKTLEIDRRTLYPPPTLRS